MSASALPHMTADQFITWTMLLPETDRYELVAGVAVAMSPERAAHARVKQRVFQQLAAGIGTANASCEAFIDSLGVRVDDATLYIPDVLVRCGPPIDGDTTAITDPLIIVEVLSPSTQGVDTGTKFTDYFRMPSLRHYLIVRAETRTVIHHGRDAAGAILTRIVRDGPILLDPPGIVLDGLFPPEPER